jgi:hypothetical protein
MGERRNAYRFLVGKPKVKRPRGRPRRRWVVNIKMVLGQVGWGDVDWIGLALDICYWTVGFHKLLGKYRLSKQLGISEANEIPDIVPKFSSVSKKCCDISGTASVT